MFSFHACLNVYSWESVLWMIFRRYLMASVGFELYSQLTAFGPISMKMIL